MDHYGVREAREQDMEICECKWLINGLLDFWRKASLTFENLTIKHIFSASPLQAGIGSMKLKLFRGPDLPVHTYVIPCSRGCCY